MCNLRSITTNQESIRRVFRKVNGYAANGPLSAALPGGFRLASSSVPNMLGALEDGQWIGQLKLLLLGSFSHADSAS
jgi:hypothetical protein